MKQFLPLLLLLVTVLMFTISSKITAQSTISYDYDAAGNRIKRHVIILPSVKADTSDQTKKSKQEIYEETLAGQKIIIYPNPTKGQLLVDIQGYAEESRIELYVYSLTGELLISQSSSSKNNSLDLSIYPAGIYVLKVTVDNKSNKWKVIKQ